MWRQAIHRQRAFADAFGTIAVRQIVIEKRRGKAAQ
jgi:hypothetical protein